MIYILLIHFHVKRLFHACPCLRETRKHAVMEHLHDDVSDGRSLGRAGGNFSSCIFCRQFIQISGIGTAAHHINGAVFFTGDGFDLFHCIAVAFCKAVVDDR